MSDLIKRARKAAGSIAVDHVLNAGIEWPLLRPHLFIQNQVSVLLRELADALENPMKAALMLAAEKCYQSDKSTHPSDLGDYFAKLAAEYHPSVCVPVEQIQKWHDFWAHYASVNEGCQDDMNEDRHATLADMLTAARKP